MLKRIKYINPSRQLNNIGFIQILFFVNCEWMLPVRFAFVCAFYSFKSKA